MEQNQKWLDWAVELQALAQAGLFYSKDIYDIERFQRIRDIAAEMLTEPSGDSMRYDFFNKKFNVEVSEELFSR